MHRLLPTLCLVVSLCACVPTPPASPDAGALPGADAGGSDAGLPDDAYGFAGEPLPSGATVVDADTYAQLKASPLFHPASAAQRRQDLEAQAALEAQNRRVVDDFLAAHAAEPDVAQWGAMLREQPDPADPAVLAVGADGYTVRFDTAAGPYTTQTLGQSFALAAAARSITSAASRENQLGIYHRLYEALPVDVADHLMLPPPAAVDQMADADVVNAVLQLSQRATDIAALVAQRIPPSPVRDCSTDFGRGSGMDRHGFKNAAQVEACAAPRATGLVATFDYPLKPHASCVKDQGRRGTCWAFAATSMMESAESVKYGTRVNYSEQDLVNRVKLTWWPSLYGDSAGQDIIPRMIHEHYRPVLENAWDYNPSSWRTENDDTRTYTHSCDKYFWDCSDTNHQGRMFCTTAGAFTICGFLGHDNPATTNAPTHASDLISPASPGLGPALAIIALSNAQQVELAFSVLPSFDGAADGFVRFDPANPGKSRGGHVVHAVGFVANSQLASRLPNAPQAGGGGWFIMKNSWGTCAGDAGYYYLPVDYVARYAYGIQVLDGLE